MTTPPPDAIWETFGLEANLLGRFEHWSVLLRPVQPTPGSCVIIANRTPLTLGDLTPDEANELPGVCRRLESRLRAELGMDKINYLALMMVDPAVHFHAIPRYARSIEIDGRLLSDPTWPGPPDVTVGIDDESLLTELRRRLSLQP